MREREREREREFQTAEALTLKALVYSDNAVRGTASYIRASLMSVLIMHQLINPI